MSVVVRRYIDFLIILLIPTPLVLDKNKNKNKKPKWRFLTSRGAHVNCAILNADVIHSYYRKSAVDSSFFAAASLHLCSFLKCFFVLVCYFCAI